MTAARRHRRPEVTTVQLVGGVEKRSLDIVDHDPTWAATYAEHEERIRRELGTVAVQVEHIGSTSVPGLAAKPIIDVLEDTKRALVEQGWDDMNAYAEAKTDVVTAIKDRARRSASGLSPGR